MLPAAQFDSASDQDPSPNPLHGFASSYPRLPISPSPLPPAPLRLTAYSAWLMALSRQSFRPTGRTHVQNSSNFTGALSLPSTTFPVVSSTV